MLQLQRMHSSVQWFGIIFNIDDTFPQLIELEQQLLTGSMVSTTDDSAEQHISSVQVAELTWAEAHTVLMASAKAALGPQRVNQICQQLVHAFLFNTNDPCSRADFHARVKTPEELKPLRIATSDNSSRCMHVKVPGLTGCELDCMLKDYALLFVYEMKKRGYSLEHRQTLDEKSPTFALYGGSVLMHHRVPNINCWVISGITDGFM